MNDFDQARAILSDLDMRFPELAQHAAYRETCALLENDGYS
jgi:hypothetical protein